MSTIGKINKQPVNTLQNSLTVTLSQHLINIHQQCDENIVMHAEILESGAVQQCANLVYLKKKMLQTKYSIANTRPRCGRERTPKATFFILTSPSKQNQNIMYESPC